MSAAAFTVRPTTKMIRTSYVVVILLVVAVFVLGKKYVILPETQYALLAIPALLLIITVVRHFSRRFVKLTIVDGRLRYQSGILSRTTRTLELGRIQDVRADQKLGQRILGIGDITVETAGEAGRLEIEDVDSPQSVAERILDAARAHVRPAG